MPKKHIELASRVKTVSWKFREVSRSYPEIKTKKGIKIKEAGIFYDTFKFLFARAVKEKFLVFWLNTANKVIGYEVVSEGILNASVAHPREVFRGAIVSSCNSIIIAHNHPSGDLEPSAEDFLITSKLVKTGNIIDIEVLDHIIFGDGYTSLRTKWEVFSKSKNVWA